MSRKKKHRAQQDRILKNMGLFWKLDGVRWPGHGQDGSKSLVGIKAGAKRLRHANFWEQQGIYALYEGFHLVYVGQAGLGDKSTIGGRLDSHRKALAGRWNRFSWFGFRRVLAKSVDKLGYRKLGTKRTNAGANVRSMADVLEGLLIEVAEPPLNGQSGRFGKNVERYLQEPFIPKTITFEDIDARLTTIEKAVTPSKEKAKKKTKKKKAKKHTKARTRKSERRKRAHRTQK